MERLRNNLEVEKARSLAESESFLGTYGKEEKRREIEKQDDVPRSAVFCRRHPRRRGLQNSSSSSHLQSSSALLHVVVLLLLLLLLNFFLHKTFAATGNYAATTAPATDIAATAAAAAAAAAAATAANIYLFLRRIVPRYWNFYRSANFCFKIINRCRPAV